MRMGKLFSFCYCLHHGMIKRKYFFHFVGMFITTWSTEKRFIFISALGLLDNGHKKKQKKPIKTNLIFIAPLPWVCLRSWKNILVFHFSTASNKQISSYIFLHLPQEFQWSLRWFTSPKLPAKNNCID